QGALLADVLHFVVASLEKQANESLTVSILLLEGDGKHLRLGATSGLPESYCESLRDGLSVNNFSGPCRVAVTEKRPVIVADLAGDPTGKLLAIWWRRFVPLGRHRSFRQISAFWEVSASTTASHGLLAPSISG